MTLIKEHKTEENLGISLVQYSEDHCMDKIILDFVDRVLAFGVMTELENIENREAKAILEYTKGQDLDRVFRYQLNGYQDSLEVVLGLITEKDKARILELAGNESFETDFLENYCKIGNEILDLVKHNVYCEACLGVGYLEVTHSDNCEYIEACENCCAFTVGTHCDATGADDRARAAALLAGYKLNKKGKIL